ncbi:MAG TPA: phosphoethanolamine transferase CptA [Methylophilaceae bacterium]|nr:phosphoethanolamine transferase CptA [Methylophilaceae bacterium]HQR60916.1 phosphoethanolamine transferase CptA [Methylophilaceae bacterium]
MAFANQANTTRNGIDWAGIGWLYLFFWYFSGLNHVLLQFTGTTIFFGFRQSVFMSLLWLVPVLLFPHRTRAISAVIGVVLWFFSLFSLGYFCIYGQEFSQSVIFIIFESNQAESSEYVAQYFSWWMIPALLVYSAVAVYLWKRIRPVFLPRGLAWAISLLILFFLFGYPLYRQAIVKQAPAERVREQMEDRMEPAVPWQMVIGYLHYREQLGNMQDLLLTNAKVPPIANLVDANTGQPATLVLVIGESTNRQHMSLYGHPRPTTPKLDAMRDQLLVFNNVFSPRPYTIETLQQVLTFADQKNPDWYLTRPSIMNMMKQAGYQTYWITNQQTMTKRNTMLTTFSKQTDKQFYLNNSRAQNSRQYDDDVLEPFQQILREPAPRKFIVVHLLGTHMKYEYRYPPEYERFTNRDGVPQALTDEQAAIYNTYDNAVLFNDHVVSSLIEDLAATKSKALLVYFSDHGEDVFDSAGHKMLGRNEGAPTVPMYAIPFIVWGSDAWRATHPMNFGREVLERRYSTSDFIYTWADFAGMRFDDFDSSKSLIGKGFKEQPLWVGDPYGKVPLVDLRSLMPKTQVAKPGKKMTHEAGGTVRQSD